MARTLKMPRPQWIRYETGLSTPGADILANICRVHACSADWLLGLRDSAPLRETNIKAGNNSAIAIGPHARASVGPPGKMAACSKCPHMKKLKKLEAVLAK
jgi:hypothetical protein